MKIQAFKWNIEVTEDYVKVNGEIVEPQNQPTDCDGTPLRYFDDLICVKPFTDSEGIHWLVGETGWHSRQDGLIDELEFTHSELKNFRKVN